MEHKVYSYNKKEEAIEAGKLLSDTLNKKGFLSLAEWNNIQEEFLGKPTTTQPEAYFNKGWTDDEDFYLDESMGLYIISCVPPYDISMEKKNYENPKKRRKTKRMIRIFGNRDSKHLETMVNTFLESDEIAKVFRIEYNSNEESGSSGHRYTRYSCMIDYNGYVKEEMK